MNSTSVGSGAADSNENHPIDSDHSKTLGADVGRQASAAQPPAEKLRFAPDSQPSAEAGEAVGPGLALEAIPSRGVPVNPDDFPDGPNVEASPWEKDAAKGLLEPHNLFPDAGATPEGGPGG